VFWPNRTVKPEFVAVAVLPGQARPPRHREGRHGQGTRPPCWGKLHRIAKRIDQRRRSAPHAGRSHRGDDCAERATSSAICSSSARPGTR
jgi:hypothetical protein